MKPSLLVAAFFVVLSGALSIELGISASVLELVAGIQAHNLLGIGEMPELDVLANLGIISLMYLAGLEIDFDMMRRNLKPSINIGFMSFAVPFIFVSVVCLLALGLDASQTALIGIALSTTSVAIIYPILLADGVIDRTERKMLSSAMVTDLFSMIALSLVFSKLSWIAGALVLALFMLTLFVPFLGRKVFGRYKGNAVEMEFKFILLLILGLTIVSETAGIESAVVAFLAGMITSEVVVGHAELYQKLRFLVFGVFAPIFFFTVGLTINTGMIMENAGILLVFLAACMAGKFLGTYIPARVYIPGREKYMGFLFNSRLSLGIVAASFGYQNGIIGQDLYAPVVGTIVVSSVISTVLVRDRVKRRL